MTASQMKYGIIVAGVSSGGLNALKTLLPALPGDFPLPVVIVQHVGAYSDSSWIELLDKMCSLRIKEADEKEPLEKGTVYIAPPNYHLLVEKDHTLSLSTEEKVNYARPSADVLFGSAAEAYGERLIGIVLTGSGSDGAAGLAKIKASGGLAVVQDPQTAEAPGMPLSAIAAAAPQHVLPIEKIIDLLTALIQPLP